MMLVSVQREPFDVSREITSLQAGRPEIGAIASFVGVVRDFNEGAHLSAMELEHYPGMTERAIEEVVLKAIDRFGLHAARVVHRIGTLNPSDQIVLVLSASSHRFESFQGCEYIMDYLKTCAPFWKKESTKSGGKWVQERDSDLKARDRWEAEA